MLAVIALLGVTVFIYHAHADSEVSVIGEFTNDFFELMEEYSMKNKFIYSSFIILECILWGIGNTVTKIGLQSIGPYTCLTIRFFISFILFIFFFPKLINNWTDVRRNGAFQ